MLFHFPFPFPSFAKVIFALNESQLGGGDVKSINVGGEAGVGLLGAVGADQGVDLDGVDVVELLEGLLDLGLVGLDVDDEDQGVVLLNLLHGGLGVEGVDDDLVLVEAGLVRDRLAGVLGSARNDEGLGAVERGGVADLVLVVTVGLGKMLSAFGLLWQTVPVLPRPREVFVVLESRGKRSMFACTYTLQGSLGSVVGLLGALRRLGGTA